MLKPLAPNVRQWKPAPISIPTTSTKSVMANAQYFADNTLNQQANTTLETLGDWAETQQGWAQPTGALVWHYYRFVGDPTGEETSICGRWGTQGVSPDDLYDKNHGCKDHCQNCRALRPNLPA
jgi:hypothetical protein